MKILVVLVLVVLCFVVWLWLNAGDHARETLAIAQQHGVTASREDDPNTRTAEEVKQAREYLESADKLSASWERLLHSLGWTNTTEQRVAASVTDGISADRFSKFPVSGPIYVGPHASADLSIPYGSNFRTRITAASREAPNFAGRYVISWWGCGTGCAEGVVVNVATGKVAWLPASFFLEPLDAEHYDYRLDSRLLIANGHDREDDVTPYAPRCYLLEDEGYPRLVKQVCGASISSTAATNTPPQSAGPAGGPIYEQSRSSAIGPGFDCAKATAPLARLICSNAELSKTDLRFNQAYFALRQQLDPTDRHELEEDDHDFLDSVRQFCGVPETGAAAGSPDCVAARYDVKRSQWVARLSGPAREEAIRPIEQHVELQRKLQELGFLPAGVKIDGVYTAPTRSAIVAWQRAHDRPATGFMGDADAALFADAARDAGAAAPPPSPASAAADGSSDASFKCRDPKTAFEYSRSFPCARGDTILASPAGYPKMGCSPDTYWRLGVGCVPNGIPTPRGAGASRQAPLEPRAPPTDDRVEKVVEWVEGVEADAGLAPPWYAPKPPYKSQESAESAAAMMYSVVEKWAEAAMTSSGGNPAQVYFSSAMTSGAIAQLYWRNALTAYEYHDPTKMREDAATAHRNAEEAIGWLNKAQESMKQIENNH